MKFDQKISALLIKYGFHPPRYGLPSKSPMDPHSFLKFFDESHAATINAKKKSQISNLFEAGKYLQKTLESNIKDERFVKNSTLTPAGLDFCKYILEKSKSHLPADDLYFTDSLYQEDVLNIDRFLARSIREKEAEPSHKADISCCIS
jgi:hypothetical protein